MTLKVGDIANLKYIVRRGFLHMILTKDIKSKKGITLIALVIATG